MRWGYLQPRSGEGASRAIEFSPATMQSARDEVGVPPAAQRRGGEPGNRIEPNR
jgi:hypothetical protein